MSAFIKMENVSKFYKTKNGVSEGMRKVSLEFNLNEFIAITGESGSGKTTLLNVLSGLDSYEDGELYINNLETSHYTVKEWEEFRSNNIGFVFQNYNVIDSYSVYQNVVIALEAQGYKKNEIKKRALELIEKVGLLSHKNQKTSKLSGGQKQRVVIARALAKNAPIILADEPTGNLDKDSGKAIMELLKEISKDKLIILVTHNYEEAKQYVTRKITMSDGALKDDVIVNKHNIESSNEAVLTSSEKRSSFAKSLKIAARNIFSTPKRSIFSTVLAMVMICIFIFFYSLLIKDVIQNITGTNSSTSSIYVENRNGSVLTNEQVTNLTHSYTSRNTKIIPTTFSNIKYGNEYILDVDFFFQSEVDGNLTSNIDEIIMSKSYMNNNYEIGDLIELFDKVFKITGFVGQSYQTTIYFNQAYIYDQSLNINESIKMISSLNIVNTDNITLRIKTLDRQGSVLIKEALIDQYRVIDRYIINENQVKFIIGTVLLMMWIVLFSILSIVFLINYFIQRNIMDSRKKDFAVYRSIGISESEVGLVILIEQVLISIMASVVTYIIFFALKNHVLFISNMVRHINISDYVLISVLFSMFALLQGLKFNKKVFNVTVIESLKEDF